MSQKTGEVIYPGFGAGDWQAERMLGEFDPVGKAINYLAQLELARKQGRELTEGELTKLSDLFQKANTYLEKLATEEPLKKAEKIKLLLLSFPFSSLFLCSWLIYFVNQSFDNPIEFNPIINLIIDFCRFVFPATIIFLFLSTYIPPIYTNNILERSLKMSQKRIEALKNSSVK